MNFLKLKRKEAYIKLMSERNSLSDEVRVLPHGGRLVSRIPDEQKIDVMQENAISGFKIKIDSWIESDLEMLGIGAFSPLEGFMSSRNYKSVLENMRLINDIVWTLPVVLSIDEPNAKKIKKTDFAGLENSSGEIIGIISIEEIFKRDKGLEAEKTYGTSDLKHPGVQRIKETGDFLVAGDIWYFGSNSNKNFKNYRYTPAETRRIFSERKWKTVVGFQTRNPIHRAHEYLQKCALEIVDGLFIHPIVGFTKDDDIPAEVRMKCYEVLLENYYPKDRVLLCVNPAAMRYAGPREAVFHAIIRKNYGCTHFIVGRDHAGVGNYYGPFDAQKIFDNFKKEEIGITPLFFDNSFYCKKCKGMATSKICPHSADDRVSLSGTKVREMLSKGEMPPEEFTRLEIAKILIEYYKNKL